MLTPKVSAMVILGVFILVVVRYVRIAKAFFLTFVVRNKGLNMLYSI